ncbi:binding protein-protein-dependent transport system inner membrane component [Rubellimicrobium mesophilum DSM 19309]|uniref:Binding protein-protein-dependent transport system inner membrane component n=1 Tax=Rubellimicrobium mesophilum DSM 19309 TaxID=442562 RepID=A0A017HRT1_9RHOB|nr:sugar ABC transporter permease [Rubellimicrobium mesophilum]EYD77207.1 binding protein-protein-dependent transport system inner membrane component [Rubellimicrobium mesophilum DSM 19309]
MPHSTFLRFMGPSLIAMLLFIALPIVSIVVQSLYVEHPQVLITSETCQPFGGCTTTTTVDASATAQLREDEPLGQFNGLGTYFDRNHLAFREIREILRTADGVGDVVSRIYNLPLYKALAFTVTYCLLVTPLAMILGLMIALAVNTVPQMLKGPVIFFSLVPMLITPLVGALILFWMLNSEGILGAAIQNIFNDPNLSTRTSAPLTWATLIAYGTWTNAPFSFIVFYAGLQAVPRDTLEAAMIDGASRLERIRYVVLPSLKPLILFVLLVQLMDNFRVFEPIISFNAAANATSLSFLIYSSLNTQTTQLFGSAAATSVITIGFIAVLIVPILLRIARELSTGRG